jgi:hypothetical protein
MSAVPQLIKALIDDAGNSERSNQLEVGPSELGSCKRQMFYKLNGHGITNPTHLRWQVFWERLFIHISKK